MGQNQQVCSNCGASITPDSQFCEKCGCPVPLPPTQFIKTIPETVRTPRPAEQASPIPVYQTGFWHSDESATQKKSHGLLIGIIVGAVVFSVICAGLGLAVYFRVLGNRIPNIIDIGGNQNNGLSPSVTQTGSASNPELPVEAVYTVAVPTKESQSTQPPHVEQVPTSQVTKSAAGPQLLINDDFRNQESGWITVQQEEGLDHAIEILPQKDGGVYSIKIFEPDVTLTINPPLAVSVDSDEPNPLSDVQIALRMKINKGRGVFGIICRKEGEDAYLLAISNRYLGEYPVQYGMFIVRGNEWQGLLNSLWNEIPKKSFLDKDTELIFECVQNRLSLSLLENEEIDRVEDKTYNRGEVQLLLSTEGIKEKNLPFEISIDAISISGNE